MQEPPRGSVARGFFVGSRFGKLLNWALIVGGLAGIIYPAFIDGNQGFTKAILKLFEPSWSLEFSMRWLCVIVFAAAVYTFITTQYYKNIPISVISTKLTAHFEDPTGSRVRVDREQSMRANEADVTAYFWSTKPTTETGSVPKNLFVSSVYCKGARLNNNLDYYGSDSKGYDIIHDFGTSMPFAWYMPLVPMWILNRNVNDLWGFIGNNIVVRTNSTTFLEEFNGEVATMQFYAENYPNHNITIELNFYPSHVPQDFKVIRIRNNGVVQEDYITKSNSLFSIYIRNLQDERLRITWTPANQAKIVSAAMLPSAPS